ncbi:hypothetical protein PIB30_098051 [Stylosanthes scabra]|uniref:Putative plant transposon protein domain-containing protein n=1 Tax=Stylosanthes scabra TaxID=79078 RepID=A0ABU6WXE1_9FABA|nr:hypothetical protein [Stylosanthes scabra]
MGTLSQHGMHMRRPCLDSKLLEDKQQLKFGIGSLHSTINMDSSSAPTSVLDDYRFREVFNQTLFESSVRRKKIIPEVAFNLNKDEVMRFKAETQGVETDFRTRQATDQRLDEVLADLCILGATWRLSSSQPAVPIQLRRTELLPLARGWQEFIIHSLVPTGNKSEITLARAILIHAIMRREDVRAEDIIADNMAVIAQGLQGKGNLSFPSTIYKLCKDAGVPLREFRRTSKIPEEKLITAKRMESTRIPRSVPA